MTLKATVAEWWGLLFPTYGPENPVAELWTVEPTELRGSGDKTHDAIMRGQHAARLLEDEILLWVLGEMRRDAHNAWESAPVGDKDNLQVLRLRVDVMKEFIARLQSLIAEGDVAAHGLAADERRREMEKRYGRVPV